MTRARIVLEELRRPVGIIVAVGVGITLRLTGRFEAIAPYLPFVVPFLVGAATRIAGRLARRDEELLVQLPALRRDPACIVDRDGTILAATGKTRALFDREGITSLNQFLAPSNGRTAVEEVRTRCADDRLVATDVPLYSSVTSRWYVMQLSRGAHAAHTLVWLDDVTTRVHLEERKDALRDFTRRLQEELRSEALHGDGDRRLAALLLAEGYSVVMLARIAPGAARGNGTLYHADGQQTQPVEFDAHAQAPIVRSRREGRAIWDSRSTFASDEAFHDAYPVLPEVARFIGEPIRNLANYHSGEVSIIAFNKSGALTAADVTVLESVADTAVTAFSLLDLARRADRRFLQSIHGVCAAAEYSDELTGEHIWRVNGYARLLATEVGLPPDEVEMIGTVAAMHDIGKVAIPHIIKLPRALTAEERLEMQMHTIYGAQIIDRMRRAAGDEDRRLDMAYRIALHHHQRWNGTGYPAVAGDDGRDVAISARAPADLAGLRPPEGGEIPIEALIVAIADTYDALRSARPYKPALSHAQAVAIMASDDRTGYTGDELFGPDLFAIFLRHQERIAAIFDREVATPGQPG